MSIRRGLVRMRRGVLGRWGLSVRFLVVAISAVALAMLGLGTLLTQDLRANIVQGFSTTTADTVGSLIAHQLAIALPNQTLDKASAQVMASIFEVGSNAEGARLLAISVFNPDGKLSYNSSGGLHTEGSKIALASALGGKVTAHFLKLPVDSIGDLPTRPITVLRIYTPLFRPGTQEILGVAELFYSADSLIEIENGARQRIWTLVGAIGAVLIVVLFVFVDRASATIDRQRQRLAANLDASNRQAEEIRRLHRASVQLRVSASLANEDLLARVGTDLHDGPLQLLTLLILNLTKNQQKDAASNSAKNGEQAATIALATSSIEELRNISAGLVLPELETQDLQSAISLAISRHEALTATVVESTLELEEIAVPKDVKVCAYRVVQEALANAYHHAGGLGQAVKAELDGNTLEIVVTNALSETQPKAPGREAHAGIGLHSMRLRVESLGGTIEFRIDRASELATVVARIPCPAVDSIDSQGELSPSS